MKKTQFIELVHTIGKTWVSFASIVVFVALGAGLYLGIGWASRATETSADAYFDQQAVHDFSIDYPYGFTADELERLSCVQGVTQVEAAYASFQTFSWDGSGVVARVQSLTSTIDVPECEAGELPTQADQIAVDAAYAQANGIAVGDTLSFAPDGDDADGMTYLNARSYTVTALVDLPSYISVTKASRGMTTLAQGAADCFLLVPQSSFDASAFHDAYPTVFVRCASLDADSVFAAAYAQDAASVQEALAALGQTDARTRYQALRDEAQASIDEGQQKVDAGNARIAQGERDVADAQQRIADGEQQIADGEELAAQAQQTIDDGQVQADEAEEVLTEKQQTLNSYQEQADYADVRVESSVQRAADALMAQGVPGTREQVVARIREILDSAAVSGQSAAEVARSKGIPEKFIKLYGAQAQSSLDLYRDYLAKKKQLAEGWGLYNDAREQLDEKEQELDDGRAQLAQKQQELEDAKAAVEDAKVQVADAQAQLDTARPQVAEAEATLASAREKFSQMEDYDWKISSRSDNAGVAAIRSAHDVTDRLRLTMASLFVIVGLLVCYTVISRIVTEEIVNIGTKKALGLRSREITMSYLLYAAFAVMVGVVLSGIAAMVVIEGILDGKAAEQFCIGAIAPYFSLGDTAAIGAIELVLICLSAWLACRRMLKRHAVDLLRGPEAPRNKPRFYEKWKAWDRLPLYSQSMVNNFFNDRLRVFGTLVGIAGCTALVVTAMTMYVNVQETFNVQYKDVYAYTGRVAMDATPQAETQIMRTVLGAGAQGTAVLRTTMALNAPDDTLSALTVEVPNDAYTFEKLYHLNDTNGGGQAQLDTCGVWLSAAYASHYGAKVGDSVRIVDASGTSHDLVIAGFFEYHLGHAEAVMSPDYYQQVFGSTAVANTVLVSFGGADAHATVDQLKQTEGFFSYTDDYALSSQQFESFQSLTRTVVIIYLGLSALMAVVVLLNLTVMFIEEKRRDLIVLMINGFSLRDAKRYIYRDNIALTVIGIVLGLLVGMAMGYFSLLSIEFAADSYVLVPSWVACATGAAASALFELCVNLVALRRIPQFNLTDINKI